MITVQNLNRRSGKGKSVTSALSDVSFSVQPGRFTAPVGESGSGKTTVLEVSGRAVHALGRGAGD